MFYATVQGFAIGASMIIPIGAQNAYVLNQGIKRNYHKTVATICIICDFTLIILGVYGGSHILASNPVLLTVVTWFGILFLLSYGGLSFYSMIPDKKSKESDSQQMSIKRSLRLVILTTLAVTLLNPHVYLDTVLIIGSVGSQFQQHEQLFFVLGCFIASLTWFYSLALTASKLSPVLSKPKTQKVINFCVGVIMWGIALSLFVHWSQN